MKNVFYLLEHVKWFLKNYSKNVSNEMFDRNRINTKCLWPFNVFPPNLNRSFRRDFFLMKFFVEFRKPAATVLKLQPKAIAPSSNSVRWKDKKRKRSFCRRNALDFCLGSAWLFRQIQIKFEKNAGRNRIDRQTGGKESVDFVRVQRRFFWCGALSC